MGAATLRRLIIVGGGTAGWMSAAMLAKTLGTEIFNITLVESEEIGTVGVGEATIPPIQLFNEILGINEDEFVRETNATFKLGIHFLDWRKPGVRYFHPFGQYGVDMDGIGFNAFWLRMAQMGGDGDYGRFNAETLAAGQNRFGRTQKSLTSILPDINYAFQFDASQYAAFLRRYSEARGVKRIEGKIATVTQHPENGFIKSVQTEDGRIIEGDFFLDCSGFRGLLIEQTLKSGYEDWSAWLPCNRAVAVPCEKAPGPIAPYTRATAREAGWQWRIPLQHRTGNGYVFCNEFIGEDEACDNLLACLDGKPLKDPKVLSFVTGHRKKIWNKNVLALGLASGFLEPLESTSIHLVQTCLTRFLAMMPKRDIDDATVDAYNQIVLAEYVNIKDFLIAHYNVTEREDTPFWKYCKHMSIPDSLKARLDIFARQGNANVRPTELFKESSWFAVLLGQGLVPRDYHPVADVISEADLKRRLDKIRANITERVKGLPTHNDFIARYCASRTS
ncbi:tryptophan halogenase family protein [Asticcacaulis benevestitus]|nr:tryptophan halogenase family protein [Asticcacaulis benevestitus]